MINPQQLGLIPELARAAEGGRITTQDMRQFADAAAVLLVAVFFGTVVRSVAREELGSENKQKIRPALDLALPATKRGEGLATLDRLIRDKQRDLWPSPSLSEARKAVYKDILEGFDTVAEARLYVEGMPEDSVLFTARGDEIPFLLIKLIIADIERNPWLSPFRPERPPDISWQPPLMPAIGVKYLTILDAGDTTFKEGEIVSPEAYERENRRVKLLGIRTAFGKHLGDILTGELLPASIPRDDLMRIADKYGWWAAKLAQAVCPHNDVACVEREASRLVKARRARME